MTRNCGRPLFIVLSWFTDCSSFHRSSSQRPPLTIRSIHELVIGHATAEFILPFTRSIHTHLTWPIHGSSGSSDFVSFPLLLKPSSVILGVGAHVLGRKQSNEVIGITLFSLRVVLQTVYPPNTVSHPQYTHVTLISLAATDLIPAIRTSFAA
ncbi:hypothetical protein BCR44DRAFT_1248455 [Catenaria anguillulae PL171]|uniref:Secreted protein n=1 Tax=Catenaria anguillulae PL171 TaxID=765915 RepID=A0A1Y2HXY2_9FUNG|nr:hypothetical protein BCR44DRAFT_1248455 [Catenaria anguillulae PL171]